MRQAWLRTASLLLCLSVSCRSQVSPSPSPFLSLPVDSYVDFSCGSQPVRSSLYWGRYNTSNVWSTFSTCNTADPVSSGTATWWEPTTPGSYCMLRSNGGQTNSASLCSGSAWGFCSPAMRWVADRAYSTIMPTVSFCAGGGCGSIVVATLTYRLSLSSPSSTIWAANTSGLAPVGGFYSGYVGGLPGLRNCTGAAPYMQTLTLNSVPAGAILEYAFAPVAGCNCAAFVHRLVINGTAESLSPSPSPSLTPSVSPDACYTRYLRVAIPPGWPGPGGLCFSELAAYDRITGANVARGKPCTSFSAYSANNVCSYGVDGAWSQSSNFIYASVGGSAAEQVVYDLGAPGYNLGNISLWGRVDCCTTWLNGQVLQALDANNNTLAQFVLSNPAPAVAKNFSLAALSCPSASLTGSASSSVSQSRSASTSISPISASPTSAATATSTASLTGGASASSSMSSMATVTRSAGATPTSAATSSASATGSSAATATTTGTRSSSPSGAPTAPPTPEATPTRTASLTIGVSASSSAAPSVSASAAASPSGTATASLSSGASASTSASATDTASSTASRLSMSGAPPQSPSASSAGTSESPTTADVSQSATSVGASQAATSGLSPSASLGTLPASSTSSNAAVTSAAAAAGAAADGARGDNVAVVAGGAGGAIALIVIGATVAASLRRGSATRKRALAGGTASAVASTGEPTAAGTAASASLNPLHHHAPSGRRVGSEALAAGSRLGPISAAAASTAATPRAASFRAPSVGAEAYAAAAAHDGGGGGGGGGHFEQVWSKSRQAYYWRHSVTGETTWDAPAAAASSPSQASAPAAPVPVLAPGAAAPGGGGGGGDDPRAGLPSGWTSVWSRSRERWYWRHDSGETSWEKPTG